MIGAILAGCSPSPSPSAPVDPPVPAASVVVPTASAPIASLRGYYEARDGGLFTACDESRRRRIARIDAAAEALLAAHAGAAGEARFVAARGERIGTDAVAIDGIELLAGSAWDCDARFDGFVYAARGVAQPWSLEVTAAAVSFNDEPGAPPLVLPYMPFDAIGKERRFESTVDGSPFHVLLREETCRDTLADTVFAWSARIEAGDRSYEGCAWRGESEP
ncbi:MAG: hypothetical protein J0L88_01580 [Xanthomonadales bacterium]|nr:hypothetical protein [Xanthomonadales bacterium]